MTPVGVEALRQREPVQGRVRRAHRTPSLLGRRFAKALSRWFARKLAHGSTLTVLADHRWRETDTGTGCRATACRPAHAHVSGLLSCWRTEVGCRESPSASEVLRSRTATSSNRTLPRFATAVGGHPADPAQPLPLIGTPLRTSGTFVATYPTNVPFVRVLGGSAPTGATDITHLPSSMLALSRRCASRRRVNKVDDDEAVGTTDRDSRARPVYAQR